MRLEIRAKSQSRRAALKANEISTTPFQRRPSKIASRRKLKLQQSREQSFVRTCLGEDHAQRVARHNHGMFLD